MCGIRQYLFAVTTFFALLAPAVTNAMTLSFECITAVTTTTNCQTGANQLVVNVNDLGSGQVRFDIINSGPLASSIEGVYFDDGTLLGISYLIDVDEGVGGISGVDFSRGAAPGELPGANNAVPDFRTTAGFLADSDPPTQPNGVNPGEWLGIVFDLQPGGSYQNVLTDLQTGNLRVGLHVIGFNDGGSESFVNLTPVPVPAAAWLFLIGLSLFGFSVKKR